MKVAASARDLVLRYGTHVAVDRSSFDIPRGSITTLIGPNGSGKSTLLNALAGLMEPAAGHLQLAAGLAGEARVAYVLQGTKINEALPVTVAEVVTMGRYAGKGPFRWIQAADREAVEVAMERMDLIGLANRHLSELSGGQRQRVFVAQGLAQDHDLLLLDEPMTGLDLPSAQAIDDVIHDEHARGCTIVMTTHDLAEARVSDFVLLLSGRVVACGPPEEVLTIDNLRAAYGPNLLHVEGEQVFIDDPHHRPAEGRHTHQDRVLHVESPGADLHPGD